MKCYAENIWSVGDVNLSGENVKKDTGAQLDAGKEFGLEIKRRERMLMPRYVDAVNGPFGNVAEFRYLETALNKRN
jgi:hypothetical protein